MLVTPLGGLRNGQKANLRISLAATVCLPQILEWVRFTSFLTTTHSPTSISFIENRLKFLELAGSVYTYV